TCYEASLAPVILESAAVRPETPPQIRLKFRMPEGATLKKTPFSALRFYLAGDFAVTRALYVSLCRYLRRMTAQAAAGAPPGTPRAPASARVVLLGSSPQAALLSSPVGSFPAFRLLHECVSFPAKFMFVDGVGLAGLAALGDPTGFELSFELAQLPDPMP